MDTKRGLLAAVIALSFMVHCEVDGQERGAAVQRVVFGVKIVQPARTDSIQAGQRRRTKEANADVTNPKPQIPGKSQAANQETKKPIREKH